MVMSRTTTSVEPSICSNMGRLDASLLRAKATHLCVDASCGDGVLVVWNTLGSRLPCTPSTLLPTNCGHDRRARRRRRS